MFSKCHSDGFVFQSQAPPYLFSVAVCYWNYFSPHASSASSSFVWSRMGARHSENEMRGEE
jgi:hypothetical protein